MPNMFEDILFQNDMMRPLAPTKEKCVDSEDLDSEILIIHGQQDLIEKSLGEDEAMVVARDCLIAFEDGVTFQPVCKKQLSVGQSEFVRVTGPGTIYIETTREESHGYKQIFKPSEQTR